MLLLSTEGLSLLCQIFGVIIYPSKFKYINATFFFFRMSYGDYIDKRMDNQILAHHFIRVACHPRVPTNICFETLSTYIGKPAR
jgi:hypothetical protein